MTTITSDRILLIEDTADTRALIEYTLQQDGFVVSFAYTADEGIELARENRYALIILDIGLPDKDGLEVCREIRQFDQQTPILFYTTFADLLDHTEAQQAGAQGCLRKPEDTARLGSVVRTLIEHSRR